MREIDHKIIEKILEKYKPNYRYLKKAYISYPSCKAIFRIGETEYMEDLCHLTDVEAQLCLNQLCYVFFSQIILDKKCKGLENLSLEEYLNLEKENMFILESNKKFKNKINSKKDIKGEAQLMNLRKAGKAYIAKVRYSLEENSSYGYLILGLKI